MCIGYFPVILALILRLIHDGRKKLFAALADEMLDKKQPALYNQGIMDFGAIQCTPQSPDCLFCPLADSCSALSTGRVAQLPVKQHKTKTTNRYFNYMYVRAGAYTYINKRTENDIWKNLFELPLIETPVSLSEEEFCHCRNSKSFTGRRRIRRYVWFAEM